jgi:purine/pyrimidine-nucleoside phosphorylase
VEHNFYFDGKMQSLGFQSDKGEATVGVLELGSYDVPTGCVEQITILSGRGRVKVGVRVGRT